MTAMHLRWSFRKFETSATANQHHVPQPKLSGRMSDRSGVERSWLASAIDPAVLRGAFALGSKAASHP